jgi:phosphatidylglycerophosphate synthase
VTPVTGVVVGLATLAALGLLVLTAATAAPPGTPLPDREGYFDRWSTVHGGYDPRGSGWARWWLGITHRCGLPLARWGVAPDVLTLWGAVTGLAVVALAAPGGRWPLLAAVVVVGSGLLDNLDGCVAVLTDRATRFGAVLDSVVDRVSDGLYLAALWALGAPGPLVVAAGSLMLLQEYARARATAGGMSDIGVVTVWERPTRVVVTAFTLLSAGLLPAYGDTAAAVGAAAWAGLGGVGLTQLLVVVRRRLS